MLLQDFPALADAWVLSLLTPVALAILISGLDDLVVDFAWVAVWLKSRLQPAPSLFPPGNRQLEAAPKARIAIFIPLWQEHAVIARMLEHNLAAIRYPGYHIFAGCYPNDRETQDAVSSVCARFAQVHMALCPHDGPTSKADCLNWVYQHLLLYEEQTGEKFEIVITHDAEDLVHPEELRWINYYAARYDFVQTPVLPLPTPIHEVTHGVYCDEFAEYHTRDMTVRAVLGGFVPSSGVGTGYRREALERLAMESGNRVFEPEALTEDYENGLRMFRLGCTQAFVPIAPHGLSDFVATREYFPRNFRAALRQRTRWAMGIALQSWQRFGWSGKPLEIYWLWRDRKGLIANPLSALANVIFIYGLATAVWSRATPAALTLAAATLSILLLRTSVRFVCTARIYGAVFALGVPLRAVYGNVLNSAAAFHAIAHYAYARVKGLPLKWLKTDHMYPNRATLLAHKRKLGEILVGWGKLTAQDIDLALDRCPSGSRLGEFLVHCGQLTEESLYEALGFQQGLSVARLDAPLAGREVARSLPQWFMRQWRVLPFRIAEGALFLASPEIPSRQMSEALRSHTKLEARFHLMPPTEFDRLASAIL